MNLRRSSLRNVLRSLLLSSLILTCSGLAEAKRAVAVLPFKGAKGEAIRNVLIKKLSNMYEVVDGQELIDASQELGISMSRGKNLSNCAKRVGVVAIVGGKARSRKLTLALYSGRSGKVIASGTIPFKRFNRKALKRALKLIKKGMRKAPRRWGKRRAAKPVEPDQEDPGTLVFEPDPVQENQRADQEENPLSFQPPPVTPPPSEVPIVAEKPEDPGNPKVEGTFGLGLWTRTLSLNQAENSVFSEYSTPGAFTLNLYLRGRPVAFFTDNFLANIYLKFRYQTVIGLQSALSDGTTTGEEVEGKSTSLNKLLIDLGYDWKILDQITSPYLALGMGYGMMSFAIDWGEAEAIMPNTSYDFLFFTLGARYPFLLLGDVLLGAHLNFDYRLVFGTGEMENDEKWFGPSSTGGLNMLVGMNVTFMKIIGRVDYTYTRYFYSFPEHPQDRQLSHPGAAAASGALDQLHSFIFSVGYSF